MNKFEVNKYMTLNFMINISDTYSEHILYLYGQHKKED